MLKEHEWFHGFDWEALAEKRMKAPFVPPASEDNFDAKYTNSEWKDANSEAMLQHQAKLKRPSVQKLFEGYYHDETFAVVQKRDGPQSLSEKPKKGTETAITHSTFVGGLEQTSSGGHSRGARDHNSAAIAAYNQQRRDYPPGGKYPAQQQDFTNIGQIQGGHMAAGSHGQAPAGPGQARAQSYALSNGHGSQMSAGGTSAAH